MKTVIKIEEIIKKGQENTSIEVYEKSPIATPMDCMSDEDAERFVASSNQKKCRNWLLAVALLFARGKLRY